MSQNQVSPVATVGFTDKERSPTGPVAGIGLQGVAPALLSIASMDRVLLASPFSMTQAKLDTMTLQDKQYAIVTAWEQGTITAENLLPPAIQTTADPVDEVHPYGTVWIASTSGDTFQTAGNGDWIQINS